MTQDVIRRELRKRGALTEERQKAAAKAEAQAAKDAAAPILSPADRDAAILKRNAELRAEQEKQIAAYRKDKSPGQGEDARQAKRAFQRQQAELQADKDARAEVRDNAPEKLVPGKPLTLAQLNALAINQSKTMANDAREVAKEVGRSVYTALSGRGPGRGTKNRHSRAAEAQRAIDEARKASA